MIKFLKDYWLVCVERARMRRAQRILVKQEWSVEFIVSMLNRAVEFKKKGCSVVLRNGTQEIWLNADVPVDKYSANPYRKPLPSEQEFDVLAGNVQLEALLDAAERAGIMR